LASVRKKDIIYKNTALFSSVSSHIVLD